MSIAQFVEDTQEAGSLEDLRVLLVDEVRAHGFDFTVYCQVSRYQASGDPASLTLISTLPDMWVSHYLRNGYSDIDPVIHRARHTQRPFLWREVWIADLLRRQEDLHEESAMMGLRHGVTVPLFGPAGQAALLSVSGSRAEAERPETARAIGAVAAQFQLVYHDLAREDGEDPVPEFVPLTPREREVLLWAGRGKSNWEIGQILHVSESAVNFHITNAMRKLDATNRLMAVLKAIRHGLIIP